MSRLNFKAGDIIYYLGKPHEAVEVYPYIAYLKEIGSSKGRICVGIGDLVMGGAHLSNPQVPMLTNKPAVAKKPKVTA